MARRKDDGLLIDLLNLLAELPWPFGLVVAAGTYFGGQHLVTKPLDATSAQVFHPVLGKLLVYASPLFVVASIISIFRSRHRKRLVEQQRSIESIRDLSWQDFELLVGEAYRRKGYLVEENGGGGADGGVDLVLRRSGKKILVQCKQWRTQKVGVKKVRELYGIMAAENAARGVLVCSGRFTQDAQRFAEGKALELVEGDDLARLIQDVQRFPTMDQGEVTLNAQLQEEAKAPLCPKCGASMALRTARKGKNAGSQFYGCSNFPSCYGTRNI